MRTLRALPKWESNTDFSTSLHADWPTAPVRVSPSKLEILGHAVMEDWEAPYMKALADIACTSTRRSKNGCAGVILEVGYGLGISARYIQKHKPRLHIIIEANNEVASEAGAFGRRSRYPVCVLQGFWEKACKLIPEGSLDGILFDTYPLSQHELYANHYRFFRSAYRMLRRGGVFTYYSDEVTDFTSDHRRRLQRARFKEIGGKPVKVKPPQDCEYWQAATILAPRIVK